jgi:hypothetical protein
MALLVPGHDALKHYTWQVIELSSNLWYICRLLDNN